MKNRLPTAIAVTALVVALLGVTGIAQAASVGFAQNAGKLLGFKPSKTSKKNTVVVRGKNGKIDARSIPAQARGARGVRGVIGPVGPPGAAGAQGPVGPITGAAPAGVTLRGNYSVAQTGSTAFVTDAIMFNLRLSAPPAVHYINVGAPAVPECPGTLANPAALPGHLCVFEGNATNTTNRGVFNTETPSGSIGFASREGAGIFMYPSTTGQAYIWGSWAATSAGTSDAGAFRVPDQGALVD